MVARIINKRKAPQNNQIHLENECFSSYEIQSLEKSFRVFFKHRAPRSATTDTSLDDQERTTRRDWLAIGRVEMQIESFIRKGMYSCIHKFIEY